MKPEMILGLSCIASFIVWNVIGDIYHRSILGFLASIKNNILRWCISILSFSILLGLAAGGSVVILGLMFGWDSDRSIPSDYFGEEGENIFLSFGFWLLAGPALSGIFGLAVSRFRFVHPLRKLGVYE